MLDANEHAATKNMRPYLEIVRHRRKTRTNGSPASTSGVENGDWCMSMWLLNSKTGRLILQIANIAIRAEENIAKRVAAEKAEFVIQHLNVILLP